MDYRQLMQEHLDGELDHEKSDALLDHLAQDKEAAEEAAQLESVHDALTRAPFMRAPQRLAATIMARLSKTIEAQAQVEPLPLEIRMALMLSTSMITMMMMPMMLVASYMVINLAYNPALLNKVIMRVIALQAMMIDALLVLLEEVEDMIRRDPQSAQVALSLIPVALKGMLESIQQDVDEIEQERLTS